jgi:hypothetical protein
LHRKADLYQVFRLEEERTIANDRVVRYRNRLLHVERAGVTKSLGNYNRDLRAHPSMRYPAREQNFAKVRF